MEDYGKVEVAVSLAADEVGSLLLDSKMLNPPQALPAPGGFLTAPFTLQAGTGDLQFLWNNGGNLAANVTVNLGWSESVVPEPATVSLFLLGAGFLGMRRSRRQAA